MKMKRTMMLVLVGSMLLTACGMTPGEHLENESVAEVVSSGKEDENDVKGNEVETSKETERLEETETSEVSENSELLETSEVSDTSEVPETSEEPETPEVPETTENPEEPERPEKPVYTFRDINLVLYAKSSVNVRDLPSADGAKVGTLSKGTETIVTGQCNETGWYRITYNGEDAYVSNNYLISEKPHAETEESKKEEEKPQKEYSVEDLDGDGKADLAEYTTWNGMTVYTGSCTPSYAKFKRDLCYAGLYVPMKYTDPSGSEIYYMLLDKSDKEVAEVKFGEELWKIGVESQVSDVMNWSKDGEVIAIWSISFLTRYEFEVEVAETLYNMEYYVCAKGKPQVNYWIIIMNGYEEDTFPYMNINVNAYYEGEDFGRVLVNWDQVSLPDEDGVYRVTAKVDEMKPGKYIFRGYYFGGMTITEHGFRNQERQVE